VYTLRVIMTHPYSAGGGVDVTKPVRGFKPWIKKAHLEKGPNDKD